MEYSRDKRMKEAGLLRLCLKRSLPLIRHTFFELNVSKNESFMSLRLEVLPATLTDVPHMTTVRATETIWNENPYLVITSNLQVPPLYNRDSNSTISVVAGGAM